MGQIITTFPTELQLIAEERDIDIFSSSTVVYQQDRGFCIVSDLDKEEPVNTFVGCPDDTNYFSQTPGTILYLNRDADEKFAVPHHRDYIAFGIAFGYRLYVCGPRHTKSDIIGYIKTRYKAFKHFTDWNFDFNAYKALASFTQTALDPTRKYISMIPVVDKMQHDGLYPFGDNNAHIVYWIN